MPTIWLEGLGGVRCARRKGAQFPCDRRTAIARRTVSDCLGSTGVLAFKGCVVKSRPRWLLDFFFETRAVQSSPPGLSPAQHTLHHHCFNASGRAVEPFRRLGERARRSSSALQGSARVRERRPRAASSSCSPISCDSQLHGTNTTNQFFKIFRIQFAYVTSGSCSLRLPDRFAVGSGHQRVDS